MSRVPQNIHEDLMSLMELLSNAESIFELEISMAGSSYNGDHNIVMMRVIKCGEKKEISTKDWGMRCSKKIAFPDYLSIETSLRDKDGDWVTRKLRYKDEESILALFNILTNNTNSGDIVLLRNT